MTKGKVGILNITYNSSKKPKVSDSLDLVTSAKQKMRPSFSEPAKIRGVLLLKQMK
jgi:hypothetical protein